MVEPVEWFLGIVVGGAAIGLLIKDMVTTGHHKYQNEYEQH